MIDKREIHAIISYGMDFVEGVEELDYLLDEIDLNKDGSIDFQEFVQHINKALKTARRKSSEAAEAKP